MRSTIASGPKYVINEQWMCGVKMAMKVAAVKVQIWRGGQLISNWPEVVASGIINPRHTCTARVTVLGRVCVSVCLSVSHFSLLERLFVLKILLCTQQATEVKKFVGFSLKPFSSTVMA